MNSASVKTINWSCKRTFEMEADKKQKKYSAKKIRFAEEQYRRLVFLSFHFWCFIFSKNAWIRQKNHWKIYVQEMDLPQVANLMLNQWWLEHSGSFRLIGFYTPNTMRALKQITNLATLKFVIGFLHCVKSLSLNKTLSTITCNLVISRLFFPLRLQYSRRCRFRKCWESLNLF